MKLTKGMFKRLIREEVELISDLDEAIASQDIQDQHTLQELADRVGELFQRLNVFEQHLELKWRPEA